MTSLAGWQHQSNESQDWDADRDLHQAWCEATMKLVYDFAEAYCNHQCDDSKDHLQQMNATRQRLRQHLWNQPASMGVANVDERYAGRLALMLECLMLDYHRNWEAAANLLDEYRAEWDKVNPQPPTFMGEPLANQLANRATTTGSPIEYINPKAQQA